MVICFFWKLWLTNQYTWLQAPDFANQLTPWYQFQASEWHAGRIPLWNPYEWAGQSLIGQAQPGVVDPFNLILYAAPLGKNGWLRQDALHWFFISGYVAAALAFFAFCRRGLYLSEPASCVAALAYSLGGIPSSTHWPQMMHATIWGPLGLLYQFRAVNEEKPLRHGALSGMFLGLTWLSGHHQIPLYFTLASAAFWLYFLYTRFITKRGILRSAILAGLFMLLFGALQILPMTEYGRNARRWVGLDDPVGWQDAIPYAIHQQFSLRPLGLLSVLLHTSEPYEPFMGVTAVALAIFGAFTCWRKREAVRWLVCLGVGGAVYALGANSFVHGILYAFLPAIEKARVPAVAMVLLNAAVAGLAAFGVDHLTGVAKATQHRRLAAAFGALAVIAAIYLSFFRFRIGAWPIEWLYATGALAILAVTFFAVPRGWAPAALAFAILFELSGFTVANWENQNSRPRETFMDRLAGDSDVAAFLQRAPGAFRINHSATDIPFSYGDYWGLETVESFTASVPAAIWNIDVFDPLLRDFASVRYEVASKPSRANQIERFRSKTSSLKVFENPDAYPRAWLVHRVQSISNSKEAKGWMKTRGPAKLTEAIIYGDAPALAECDAGAEEIAFTRRVPNEVRLRVKAGCKAMLILNDAWDPGWKAYVDGKATRLWQADGFVRGLVLDGGDHEVRMVYRPNSVLAGLACLLAGLVGLAWIWRKDAAPAA